MPRKKRKKVEKRGKDVQQKIVKDVNKKRKNTIKTNDSCKRKMLCNRIK